MKNTGIVEQQKPLSMFTKMLSDSTMFYFAAKAAWNEAVQLLDENKESQRQLTEGFKPKIILLEIGGDRLDTFHLRLESALTVATMNYCIAIELLMKTFIGVNGRFDQDSLDVMRNEVSHNIEKIFQHIPKDWAQRLEAIYQTAEMKDTEVAVFWSGWNPPNGRWIGDSQRLATPTLKKFLCFLSTEKLYTDRYSFKNFSNNDWRVKLCGSQKIESFQHEVEKFLLEKAEENECWSNSLTIHIDLEEDQTFTIPEVLSISSRAIFQLNKAEFGQTK